MSSEQGEEIKSLQQQLSDADAALVASATALKENQATIASLKAMLKRAVGLEIGDVFVCNEVRGDNRWYAWKSADLEDLSGEGFDTFDDVCAAIQAAGWLQPTPEAQRQAELNAEHD